MLSLFTRGFLGAPNPKELDRDELESLSWRQMLGGVDVVSRRSFFPGVILDY